MSQNVLLAIGAFLPGGTRFPKNNLYLYPLNTEMPKRQWLYDIQGSNDPIYDCLGMKLYIEVELNHTNYWDPSYDDTLTQVQEKFLDGVVAWFRMGNLPDSRLFCLLSTVPLLDHHPQYIG